MIWQYLQITLLNPPSEHYVGQPAYKRVSESLYGWKKALTEYLIGAGGWAYFRVPGVRPLVAYSKAFNFVEVNSTFYQMPSLKEVETWRKLVPPDFQFSVRASRKISHKLEMEPTSETFEIFDAMKRICDVLNADILHLLVPASVSLSKTLGQTFGDFLRSVSLGRLRLALEVRGTSTSELAPELVKVMQDNNVIHCVDLANGEMPAYKSDVLYSRLFGKGFHNVYEPTDGELVEVDKKTESGNFRKIVMSFHFVKMYTDAARLKAYKETGKFPKITGSTGLSSLEEVLNEDATFPATKQELISDQGWKLFDLTEDKRVSASDYLQKLPERTYNSTSELIDTLRPIVG
jgi:uncharacterized protein YecE (DUF72 family)